MEVCRRRSPNAVAALAADGNPVGTDPAEPLFKLYNADPELVKTTLTATGDDRETDTARWMTKTDSEQ